MLGGLLFLFTIFFPSVEDLLPVGIHFPFVGNLFYVVFGGLAAINPPKPKTRNLLILLGLLSVIFSFFYDLPELHYRHPVICFMAVSIFLFFRDLSVPANAFLTEVSACTWGIYLLHPFFINLLLKLFRMDLLSESPYLKLSLFFLFISFVSLIFTKILRSIPGIRNLF